MTDALMKYETIDRDQIDDIMAGKDPREPKGWSDIDDADNDTDVDMKQTTTAENQDKKNNSSENTDKSVGAADQH